MTKVVAIIPSRLESSRVHQKPLVDICGMPMIAHIYHRAILSDILDDVWVATDSELIIEQVEKYGGKALLTSNQHQNGTERVAEAASLLGADRVVLVNGDEALLDPTHIADSYNALLNSDAQAAMLVNQFDKHGSTSDFKVVLNYKNEIMYISRADIPCGARIPIKSRFKAYHILAFRKGFLDIYSKMAKSPLEKIEDHEHLRILENGYKMVAKQVESSAISVDTLEDLEFVRRQMYVDPYFQRYRT